MENQELLDQTLQELRDRVRVARERVGRVKVEVRQIEAKLGQGGMKSTADLECEIRQMLEECGRLEHAVFVALARGDEPRDLDEKDLKSQLVRAAINRFNQPTSSV